MPRRPGRSDRPDSFPPLPPQWGGGGMMGGTRSDDVYGKMAAETPMLNCCFDKRVWAGLGWTALPVLAGLACPMSMLFMMRGMARSRTGAPEPPDAQRPDPGRAAEI